MHYVSNRELADEIARCQLTMTVSKRLAEMLYLLVTRIALKPNWRSYSYIMDMKSDALLQLLKHNEQTKGRGSALDTRPNILKFDFSYAERSGKPPNPFSYATQIVTNVFRRFVKLEQAMQGFRDDCLTQAGLTPSNKRQLEDDANRSSEPIPPRYRRGSPGRPSSRKRVPK